jgi:sec-independent protein translocase protein TatB
MNLGMPEMLFIFLMALVVFGPKRLPELARQLGKIMGEFKRATNDFKYQIENEIEQLDYQQRNEEREKSRAQQLVDGELTILTPPPPGAVSSTLATGSGIAIEGTAPPSDDEQHEARRVGHHHIDDPQHEDRHPEPEQMNLPTEEPAAPAQHREPNVI